MCSVLTRDTKQRKSEIKQYQSDTMMTPETTINWGKSKYIQGIRSTLKSIKSNPHCKIGPIKACQIHNYIIMEICLGNATRCSNIREMRVVDFLGVQSSELPNAMEINSMTSIRLPLYMGEKAYTCQWTYITS